MCVENFLRNLVISDTFAEQITNCPCIRGFRRRTFMGDMTRSYSSTWRRVANGFMCEITKGKTVIALREAAK